MSDRVDRANKVIRAAPNRIYQALTSSEKLTQWLAPHGMSATIENFVLREGGGYRMTLTYEEQGRRGKTATNTDVVDVRFVRLSPDCEVKEVATFQSPDPAFAGAMIMTWTLKSAGDATAVEIVCENVPDGIKAADHAAGLRSSLDNLAQHVETHH